MTSTRKEKRPLKFGMNALRKFASNGNLDLGMFEGEMNFNDVLKLIHIGLEEGARKEQKEFKFTIDDVCDWLDDDVDKIEECITILTSQMPQSKKVIAPQKQGH